jgi:hypothetical protein
MAVKSPTTGRTALLVRLRSGDRVRAARGDVRRDAARTPNVAANLSRGVVRAGRHSHLPVVYVDALCRRARSQPRPRLTPHHVALPQASETFGQPGHVTHVFAG